MAKVTKTKKRDATHRFSAEVYSFLLRTIGNRQAPQMASAIEKPCRTYEGWLHLSKTRGIQDSATTRLVGWALHQTYWNEDPWERLRQAVKDCIPEANQETALGVLDKLRISSGAQQRQNSQENFSAPISISEPLRLAVVDYFQAAPAHESLELNLVTDSDKGVVQAVLPVHPAKKNESEKPAPLAPVESPVENGPKVLVAAPPAPKPEKFSSNQPSRKRRRRK